MLNWFTYLGMLLAKTYLGAFVLFIVGAPSLYSLTARSIPTWKEYFASFRDFFLLIAGKDTNYMWLFILVSCPVGFLVCEIVFRFNNWVRLHDDLGIFGDQTQKEYFNTMIFIQRHEHLHRVYHWESFQSNLFLCVEYTLEFFLAFHLTASLVIGIAGSISDKITLDSWNAIPVVVTFLFAFLAYLEARQARKKKYIAFRDVYQAICELKDQEEAKAGAKLRFEAEETLKAYEQPQKTKLEEASELSGQRTQKSAKIEIISVNNKAKKKQSINGLPDETKKS